MKKLYFSNDYLISCDVLNGFGLDVYDDIYDRDEIKYIDDDKLWHMLNDVVDNIKDSELSRKLRDIGIYVKVDFEVDKTLWEDLDNNHIFW